MTNGILMLAIGEHHQREAAQATERIRLIWPEIEITINTQDSGQPVQLQRIRAMKASPYARTLYLDTDTWLMEPVPELFDLLDRFDVALAHAPWRERYPVDISACYPEFNGGVFVYGERCRNVLFAAWERQFLHDLEHRDPGGGTGYFPSQPSLRVALYHSGLCVATLPPEYNWRGDGYAHGPIKIIHSRQLKRLKDEVNQRLEPRVCIGGKWHYADS